MVEREQEKRQANRHQEKKVRWNPHPACIQENEGINDSQVREPGRCNATSKALGKSERKVRHRNILPLLR
jgi:hypothetical protein